MSLPTTPEGWKDRATWHEHRAQEEEDPHKAARHAAAAESCRWMEEKLRTREE